MWSSVNPSGTHPDFGTRPNVGIRPETPQNAAGMRMLPPVSVPIPVRKKPAATPLPVPELDPPGHVVVSHGLRGIGNGLSKSGMPIANSIVVTLPVITAPAALRRATTGPSLPAPQSGSSTRLLAVVGPSAIARMSFMPTGMPCNGPRSTPAASSASAVAAARSAAASKRAR